MDIKKPTKAELTAWLKDFGFVDGTRVFIPASKVADMPDLPATSVGDLLDAWLKEVETPEDYNLIPKEQTVDKIDLTKKTPVDYWRKLALDFRADRNKAWEELTRFKKVFSQTVDRITTEKNELRDRLRKKIDALYKHNEELRADFLKQTVARNKELDELREALRAAADYRAGVAADLQGALKVSNKLREEVEKYIEAIKENNAAHHETHKELKLARQEAEDKQKRIDHLRAEWCRTIDLALAYEDKLQQINKEWPGILGGEELRALMAMNRDKA